MRNELINMPILSHVIICTLYQSPFENLARRMTDVTGDEGVLKKILRQGEGV